MKIEELREFLVKMASMLCALRMETLSYTTFIPDDHVSFIYRGIH